MAESQEKRHKPYAARYRARAHATAHENLAEHDAPMPEHVLIPRGQPTLIVDNEKLGELIVRLRAAKRFAYDSEFIGELTYIPNLCLIQVASTTEIALIDPLSDIDLTPFWELLCDDSVEKIVHAGQQDIEPVVRHLNRSPRNVFDTQIVAGFCGLTYPVSLSKLAMELTGAKLGKSLTFSHWDQRPLSAQQLKYAADDVRYLPAIHAILSEKLASRNATQWARHACDDLCEPNQYRFNPETAYLKLRQAGSLQPRGLAILKELAIWRDATARKHNVPPRTIAKDETLIDLARNPVKTLDKLATVRDLPRPVKQDHGDEILSAITRGQAAPLDGIGSAREPDQSPSEKFSADSLWALVQSLCVGQGIDPALVVSRNDIPEVLRFQLSQNGNSLPRLFRGWRNDAIGKRIVELLDGKSQLHLTWTGDVLQSSLD